MKQRNINPIEILRYMFTIILPYLIYLETGIVTAICMLLIAIALELTIKLLMEIRACLSAIDEVLNDMVEDDNN